MMYIALTLFVAQSDVFFEAAIATGREKCQQGQRLSIELKAKEAEAMYEEGIEGYLRGLPKLDDLREYARCLIDYGASLLANQQTKPAEALFARGLVLETGEEIDSAVHNPRVVAAFVAVKKRVAKTKRTRFSVVGTPENATVHIDGRDAGRLPNASIELFPGEHLVRVHAEGHSPFFSRVRVPEAKEDQLSVALTPVESAPPIVLEVVDAGPGMDGPVKIVHAPRPTPNKVHPFVALLPLGIGQFAEKRYGIGAVFMSTQLLLLGANIGSFWGMRGLRGADGFYAPQDIALGTGLLVATNVALGLLLVDLIIGTIDGLLHREVAP